MSEVEVRTLTWEWRRPQFSSEDRIKQKVDEKNSRGGPKGTSDPKVYLQFKSKVLAADCVQREVWQKCLLRR